MSGDSVKAFGLVIKALRHAQNLSQEALAFEASIDRTFLSQLETGRKQPTLLTIFRLAAALKLEASDLIKQVEAHLSAT
ncbi:MAG: XRE family transcriptional regulator [Hymenobacter sp.]|nr:MAG: XRE family transcriptional regulator [Hymenobacter sp.]